ncbi:hypothetical protein [uncultured Acetobacteroides sp.]|uniref:hypothetical protein n=1 Tax=uncultured Acetobacteroides sp. TaxID=1760811 RepID=UPI0029F5855C|nr:hypothetical protein [uncultured Acetobacteroides sp.]
MKNLVFLPLLLLLMGTSSYAQDPERKWAFGIFLGKNEYDGDFGSGIANPDIAFYPLGGLSLNRYLTPSFDAAVFCTYGQYGYYKSPQFSFLGTKTDGSLLLYYKLANGHIFRKDALLRPFLAVGLGVATYSGSRMEGGTDITLPIGGGIKYCYSRSVAFQYQLLMNYTNNDNHDGFVNGYNEVYVTHTIGLVLTLGTSEDKHGKYTPTSIGCRQLAPRPKPSKKKKGRLIF